MAEQLEERNVVFAVAGVRTAALPELERFGLTETIGQEHIFPTLEEAIDAFHPAKPAQ